MDKKFYIGVIAVLVVFSGFLATREIVVKPADVQIVSVAPEKSPESFGAIPGDEITGNCFKIGGITKCYYRQAFVRATTTPCSIKSPGFFTRLSSYAFSTVTSTSSAGEFHIGTSTTAFATSTSMTTVTVAANAAATSTWDGSSNTDIIAPSTYVNIGVSGAGTLLGGYTYPKAVCSAIFQAI